MRIISTLLLSLALSIPALPASAAFVGPGAQKSTAAQSTSVTQASQVQSAADNTPCVLEGQIIERTHKNKYVFQDASGKVTVEISRKAFGAENVTPQTKVRLYGEVDTDKDRPHEVEVRHVEIVK